VRGAGVEPVVAMLGADGGQIWQLAWRWFPDDEGDGGLMDSGSWSSS
jgi:hypothetical protein